MSGARAIDSSMVRYSTHDCVCVCEAGGGVCVVLSSSGALETASMSVV